MPNNRDLEVIISDLWNATLVKYLPCEVLKKFNTNVEKVCQNGALATTFHKTEFDDKFSMLKYGNNRPTEAKVLFHDDFFKESRQVQEHVILHEFAHLYLNHHTISEKTQDEKEIEAEELAKKWIADYKKQEKKAMTKLKTKSHRIDKL